MKKFISIILILMTAVLLFAGCGSNKKAEDKTSDIVSSLKKDDNIAAALPDYIKSAGEIKIGVDDSYPPMEYRDDKNNLIGFDVDMGNAIGKKLGVNMKWVPTAFDGIIPALQSKKFDIIIASLSITDKRKQIIGFSEPYIQGGPIIITLKGDNSIKTADDFKGKVVGVQLGSTGETATDKISGVKEIKRYEKITEALMDLAAKRVEAVVADDQVGRYYIGLDPAKYQVAGKMADEPFGIGFRKDDTALNSAVQKAIDELKAEGTLSKISLKWFKTDYYNK